ncbi:MAG: alkaline phosphatase, partial [Sinobacteraceae bacterium]|nr:alkaline phosphatase [Nevskiaceae bacterium]
MRRLIMAAAIIATMALAACDNSNAPPATGTAPPAGTATPKNVIFFLGDGYGIVPMTATRIYSVGENGQLAVDKLPDTAFVKTFAQDAQVTDSAAAMS